jgi:hypothetical protein
MRVRLPQKLVLAAGAAILLFAAFMQSQKYEPNGWLALACFLPAIGCLFVAFVKRDTDDSN